MEERLNSNFPLVLTLSGGGFRATLFHLGALRRLNELGLLSRVQVICSVSGGSLLNGILASKWGKIVLAKNGVFSRFNEEIEFPTIGLCQTDIRTAVLLGERLKLSNLHALFADYFSVRANYLTPVYSKFFEGRALSDVASPFESGTPRFIFCATNFHTGACWQFHTGRSGKMGDFYTGYTPTRNTSIADAVAASSAFPPGFAPFRLQTVNPDEFDRTDPWGDLRPISKKRVQLTSESKRTISLTDGGVYDNLGIEPIWKKRAKYKYILVSDAGHPFSNQQKSFISALSRLGRASSISMEQVGAVRKRWLIDLFRSNDPLQQLKGSLWAIDTLPSSYNLNDCFSYSPEIQNQLAQIRTDLNAFNQGEIACLINHGYSLADCGIRRYFSSFCLNPNAPFEWPYPDYSDPEVAQIALENSSNRNILRDVFRYFRDNSPT